MNSAGPVGPLYVAASPWGNKVQPFEHWIQSSRGVSGSSVILSLGGSALGGGGAGGGRPGALLGSLLAKFGAELGLSQPSYAGGAMDPSIGGADGADGADGALMSSACVHDWMQPSQTRVGVG